MHSARGGGVVVEYLVLHISHCWGRGRDAGVRSSNKVIKGDMPPGYGAL